MDNDLPQTHPHLTPEAQARRRRLGEQFDRAACTADESLENALADESLRHQAALAGRAHREMLKTMKPLDTFEAMALKLLGL